MLHHVGLIDQLSSRGFAVEPQFLSAGEIEFLREDLLAKNQAGFFRQAGVGKDSAKSQQSEIRRDRTLWFDENHLSRPQAILWEKLQAFREVLNQELFLGLWDLEGHYAIYEPGGFYKRHRDRFANDSARTVSCVLYLNDDWKKGDGGELHLFPESEETVVIEPRGGTFVTFMSSELEHEVQTSNKTRLSFAGWMRTRATT